MMRWICVAVVMMAWALTGCTQGPRAGEAARAMDGVYPVVRRENSRTPVDMSTIRGANYCYAEYGGHPGMWNNYSPAITERDLGYAQRLGINQIRCFITYQAYQANPEAFRRNLLHLVRAADQRGMGVMPVVGYVPQMLGEGHPGAEAWAKFLVETLGKEPGLAFWDVSNEPDFPETPTARVQSRIAFARYMAGVFRKLDGKTPVTIGCAFEPTMEELTDDVDVLVFHNYLHTRAAIRANIVRAKAFAAGVRKQVIDDEIGCVGRANPYDVTIQEHMDGRVGWYMWELMIVWDQNGRGWGNLHGIFYPDGTVRDPSIALAVMGIFRNRGLGSSAVVLEEPDREGWVKRAIASAQGWLAAPEGNWDEGLDAAETAANLMESAQMVGMRELPTRQVEILRRGAEDRGALRAMLEREIEVLRPYVK